MDNVCWAICGVSFVPSVLFLVYALFLPITKRYTNAKWQFATLKAMMVLFIIPVYSLVNKLANDLGAYFNIPLPHRFFTPTYATGFQTGVYSDFSASGIVEKASRIQIDVWAFLASLWVLGIVVIVVYQVHAYRRFLKRTKTIIPAKDLQKAVEEQKGALGMVDDVLVFYDVYTDTPMLIGIAKPKIVLPCIEIEQTHLKYVLTHELTHLKQKDLWWKLALQGICTMHWFNPLVYRFRMEFEKQLEYACDERVVEALSFDERKEYGFAILQSVQVTNKTTYSFLGVGFSTTKQKLERRITNMLNFKNMKTAPKVFTVGIACTLLTIIAIPAFTNGVSAVEAPPTLLNWTDAEHNVVTYNGVSATTYQVDSTADLMTMYGEFGVSFDENDRMLFNGELVRYFYDGVVIDENTSTSRHEFFYKDGVVDVITKREVIENGDGSINPFGPLMSLEKATQLEFDQRDCTPLLNPPIAVITHTGFASEDSGESITFESLLKRFEPYGITFTGSNYRGNIYYNGILVDCLSDTKPNGSVTSLESIDGGKIDVVAVYDEESNLVGVKEV